MKKATLKTGGIFLEKKPIAISTKFNKEL